MEVLVMSVYLQLIWIIYL